MTTALPDSATWISRTRSKVPSPIESGLQFLAENLSALFALGIGPALISIACAYVVYFFPLAQHEIYLVVVLYLVSLAWLVNAIVAFRVLSARGMVMPYRTIALRTFHALPKVLVSFCAVIGIFVLCFWYPYLLALTLCFLWAPFFVAGEAFAKVLPEPEFDDDDELFEEDDETVREEREERLFSNHHLWQLGLRRSFVFGLGNIVTTLEIVALFWFAWVAPTAFLRFVFTDPTHFSAQLFEAVLPVFSLGAVVMIAAGALLSVLPKSAREEIELPKLGEWESVPRGIQHRPSLIVFFLILPLAVLSSWYTVVSEGRMRQMPAGVRYQSESVWLRGDALHWRVRIEDPDKQFRWFVPQNFRLVAQLADPVRAEATEPSTGSTLAQKPLPVVPERFYVLDSAGRNLADTFRPWSEPLSIELRFPLTGGIRQAEQFALHYGAFGILPEQHGEKELGAPLATTRRDAIEEEK